MEPGSAPEEPCAVTARDLVIGYIDALNAVGAAMRESIPLERPADILSLARTYRDMGRSGGIGTYHYRIHGAGCLFVSDDGTEIDVDFTAGCGEIFDFWRLRRYGRSLPEPCDPTDQELRSAVESLKPQLIELRPGWFSVAEADAPAPLPSS